MLWCSLYSCIGGAFPVNSGEEGLGRELLIFVHENVPDASIYNP